MDEIIKALQALRVGIITQEYDLQAEIAKTLMAAGIGFMKEYYLGPGNRVDFFVDGGIAIEVKKGKPNRSLLISQIERYAAFAEVRGIIIVVETSLYNPPEKSINGKPCAILGLKKLWGLAL